MRSNRNSRDLWIGVFLLIIGCLLYTSIALPGVDGLNAVEHLRALCRNTRIIWCSDLDFSLHAFRLRADYFLLEPVTKAAFQQGLYAWLNEKNSVAQLRPNYAETNKEDYS